MKSLLRPAFSLFLMISILTGVIYPLVVTIIAQVVFPHQANGSLIKRDGTTIGSQLIGQNFTDQKYFWGRLSATNPPYNAAASGGSNFGPLNPALQNAAKARIAKLKKYDPTNTSPIPVDLVTSSGSGLDPQISIAAADYQIARVAQARNLSTNVVRQMVERNTQNRAFGVFGEPCVNVLKLNVALDQIM